MCWVSLEGRKRTCILPDCLWIKISTAQCAVCTAHLSSSKWISHLFIIVFLPNTHSYLLWRCVSGRIWRRSCIRWPDGLWVRSGLLPVLANGLVLATTTWPEVTSQSEQPEHTWVIPNRFFISLILIFFQISVHICCAVISHACWSPADQKSRANRGWPIHWPGMSL